MSATAIPAFNTSGDPVTEINCVYAISGLYGMLPRLLYYVTLAFAIFGRTREWLIIGALVSALTYAGGAAIHMMALVTSKAGVYDLDVPAAWAVLSTGALGYIGMIHWSTTLRNSNARIIMVCWGVLVGVSLIFGRAILFDTPPSDPEPACYSSLGKLLEYPGELINPQFNCTYKCFDITKPMRHPSEIIAIPSQVLNNRYSSLLVALVGPIQFVAYAALSLDGMEHSPSKICQLTVMKYLIHPGHKEEFTKIVYKASVESWYGGYFAVLSFIGRTKWSPVKTVLVGLLIPWLFLGLVIDILCIPLMIANIVINEIMLQTGGWPVNESINNVGQWMPIVNSTLVVIAACISKFLELRERSKKAKVLGPESEGSSLDTGTVSWVREDEESGALGGGQVTGVVKPKLVHVQTLQDMQDLTSRDKR